MDEKKQAQEEIANLVHQAYSLITTAENIADQHDLRFSFDLAYGMGGTYKGEEGEWLSSTESCR